MFLVGGGTTRSGYRCVVWIEIKNVKMDSKHLQGHGTSERGEKLVRLRTTVSEQEQLGFYRGSENKIRKSDSRVSRTKLSQVFDCAPFDQSTTRCYKI